MQIYLNSETEIFSFQKYSNPYLVICGCKYNL